ncbi:MAG: hypothetical protein SVS85_00550 [Candidatus Nanohaloarchaea archaeon]|nr:hypothetical protein [Candidatus Nanohaloarchaea archaeon]
MRGEISPDPEETTDPAAVVRALEGGKEYLETEYENGVLDRLSYTEGETAGFYAERTDPGEELYRVTERPRRPEEPVDEENVYRVDVVYPAHTTEAGKLQVQARIRNWLERVVDHVPGLGLPETDGRKELLDGAEDARYLVHSTAVKVDNSPVTTEGGVPEDELAGEISGEARAQSVREVENSSTPYHSLHVLPSRNPENLPESVERMHRGLES